MSKKIPHSDQSTDELLAGVHHISESCNDPDDEERWEYVNLLRVRQTEEVFDAASQWCKSAKQFEQLLGIDILAQLGAGANDKIFAEQSRALMLTLLELSDSTVLNSTIIALGHLGLEGDHSRVASFVDHPDRGVRYAVAFTLGGEPETEIAVRSLIQLSDDPDDEVRNWATFGLGSQSEQDTSNIRDALFRRAQDKHDETRGEALLGLALRQDKRALDLLLNELSGETVGSLAIEAAREFGDSRLRPALEKLSTWWDVDTELVQQALSACSANE